MDLQAEINRLSFLLRLQVIEKLVNEDSFKYNGKAPAPEEITTFVKYASQIDCCTKLFPRLFRDAHEMHEEKGMFPHPVTVGDLEWCIKNRTIGYQCSQSVPQAWLPYKEDRELRALPAFKEIAKIYNGLIAAGKKILAPTQATKEETNQIVYQLSKKLKMDNALCSQK